jgi:autotransporter-associated beta strand protein
MKKHSKDMTHAKRPHFGECVDTAPHPLVCQNERLPSVPSRLRRSVLLVILLFVIPYSAQSAIIYSGLRNIAIPTTFDGIYLDIDTGATSTSTITGWDLNFFFGGIGIGGSDAFQPARMGTGNMDTIRLFGVGDLIDNTLSFSTGETGSSDHLGATGNFKEGVEGYLGFRFTRNNLSSPFYGYMRLTLTANEPGAVIHDWAWDDTGGSLQVASGSTAGILGSTSPIQIDSILSVSRDDAFSITAQISGTGSLTQAGAGTTTVTGANTFTGDVKVTGGTLSVNAVGSSSTPQPLGQATTPVTLSSGGRLSYTGVDASWDRGITVATGSTGTVQNSGSGELILTGPISKDGSTLTFSGTQPIKVGSVITGASANSDLVIEDTTVTLANANAYNGPTTVNNGGKLVVTNTTGSATSTGNVQANSGSVILGTGFIQPASGGTVTISSGAKVSVGNVSGDTTGKILTFTPANGSITTFFQSGSTLEFDLFSGAGQGDQTGNLAAADILRTGGLFDISTGVKLKVNSAMTGFAANDSWRLLDWYALAGTAPTGTFDTALLELPTLTGTLGWDLSKLYTAGTISVVVVPEPTRALLFALGLIGLLIRRRR